MSECNKCSNFRASPHRRARVSWKLPARERRMNATSDKMSGRSLARQGLPCPVDERVLDRSSFRQRRSSFCAVCSRRPASRIGALAGSLPSPQSWRSLDWHKCWSSNKADSTSRSRAACRLQWSFRPTFRREQRQPPARRCCSQHACALAAGIVNGVMVGLVRLNAIVATIGMNALIYGAYSPSPVAFRERQPLFAAIAGGDTWGVGNAVYFALALLLVVAFVLKKTVVGRRSEAISANPLAARAIGLHVRLHQMMAYVYAPAALLLSRHFARWDYLSADGLSGRTRSCSPRLPSWFSAEPR